MTGQVPDRAPKAKAMTKGAAGTKPRTAQTAKEAAVRACRPPSTGLRPRESPSLPPASSPAAETTETADMKAPAAAWL